MNTKITETIIKRICGIVFIIGLVLVQLSTAQAATINVKVDGQTINFPDQGPVVQNERILVPVRFPMEAMNVTPEWLEDTQQAKLTKGDTVAIFTIGQKNYTVNGVTKTMDTEPIALNGRTLFPIRFAAEAFDATVSWDGPSNTALITSAGSDIPQPKILIYPKDKAHMVDQSVLMIEPTGSIQGIKVQCVNNDAVNIDWMGRLDQGFYGYYELYSIKGYGTDTNYQIQPGETLVFDVWIEYWPDGQEIQTALVYDDYTFVVPQY